MRMNVSALFNKFAHQEISVLETNREIDLGGEKMTFPELSFADNNDPLLVEMRQTAKENGLTLRIWLPGTLGTMDMRPNRVNVHVEKHEDGKWRIAPQFTLG